jgi:endonuclease/exonuclease/phosphatase family metal-dependent hydrolase
MASTPTGASRTVLIIAIALLMAGALVAVATPAEAARRPTPRAVRATAADHTSLTVRWHRVRKAPGYRVRWSAHRSMAGSHRVVTPRARVRIGGLAPDTRYYVQVAVAAHRGHGRRLSHWSRVLVRRTPPPPCPKVGNLGDPTPAVVTGQPSDLTIASFNIRTINFDSATHPEQRWRSRAGRVASLLLGAATTRNAAATPPEIIALQEANQSYGKFATRCTNQMIDLRNRLNAAGVGRYEATSLSPWSSVGTRILFDTTRLRLESAGSVLLAPAGTTHPHLAWGIFQQRDGGQRFFFGDVHLVPKEAANSHLVRDAEWDRLLTLLTSPTLTRGLPVILGGDFNSPRSGWGVNTSALTHLRRMYDAGFGDLLLGDNDPSDPTLTTDRARTQPNTNAECASFNGFVAAQRCEPAGTIGQQIDYLFASNDLAVKDWELVLDTDDQGNWIGTIPSDHNLLRATVTLPGAALG